MRTVTERSVNVLDLQTPMIPQRIVVENVSAHVTECVKLNVFPLQCVFVYMLSMARPFYVVFVFYFYLKFIFWSLLTCY